MVESSRIRAAVEAGLAIMQDVLNPILNREVTISITSVGDPELPQLMANFLDSPVRVGAPLEGGISGSLTYLFNQRLTAAITDLMVMGDGSAPFSEQESLDGISEAINQIVGALSTFWTDKIGSEVRQTGAKAELIDLESAELDLKNHVQVDFKISIDNWGDDAFSMLVPVQMEESFSIIAEEEPGTTEAGGLPEGAVDDKVAGETPDVSKARFAPFDTAPVVSSGEEPRNLELLMDISLPLTIELGRTNMLIREILEIGPGSVIELQKLSGEPVDLFVNDRKFALGEVVVIDENFGIRITELLSVEDRVKALK